MARVKKFLLITLSGVSGLLLTLAGFSLIQLSNDLIKYTGVVLLIVAILMWVLPDGRAEI